MQKRTTKKIAKGEMTITVSKFGDDPRNVIVPVGSTVADVLKAASITLTGRETAFVEGEQAERGDILENADILSIVTPKQAG
jgi:hypothetical protein